MGTTQTPVLYHVPPDLTFRTHPLCSPPGQPVWQADCLLERAESQGPVSGAPGGHAARDLSRNLCRGARVRGPRVYTWRWTNHRGQE